MKTFDGKALRKNGFLSLPRDITLALFLAIRAVKRASLGTSLLIISIQILTVLNLLLVNGILVGLIEGSETTYRLSYSGDIFISPLITRDRVENTEQIMNDLRLDPDVTSISRRYTASGFIASVPARSNLKDVPNETGTTIVGLNPANENSVTKLDEQIIAGRWLEPTDTNGIVLGNRLLQQYFDVPIERGILRNVELGDKVTVSFGTSTREFHVIGIVFSKIDPVARRAYILDRQLLALTDKFNLNAGEIAISLQPGADPEAWVNRMKAKHYGSGASIKTARESMGSFFSEVTGTFALIANIIGGIALLVAAVTVFIITFINAVTRRKFIGILKGIGVTERSIEIAYVLQAVFYALVGIGVGVAMILVLDPYFDKNPIDFPFSDGILSVTTSGILIRSGILLAVTFIAGYLPARRIVHGNTLDAILGR